jgi:hypothetical protein
MDGDISGQAPWTSEMFVLAMALAGLAWLTLVLGIRWQLRTKAVAALPGLATVGMALAVAVTIGDAERGEDNPLPDDAAGGRRVVCSPCVGHDLGLAAGSSHSPSLTSRGGGAVGHHSLWHLPPDA